MRDRTWLWLVAAAVLVAGACGEEDSGGRTGAVLPECEGNCLRLEVVYPTAGTARVTFGSSIDLKVKYVGEQGQALSGFQVNFTAQGDPAGAMLQASSAQTDAEGIATMPVIGGQAEADFEVEASALKADPVSIHVSVRSKDGGDLEVRLAYQGARSLGTVRVSAFDLAASPLDCATVDPALPGTALGFKDVTSLGTARLSLDTGKQVGVLAVAQGSGSAIAAWGCNAGPFTIPGGASVAADVELKDVVPTYAGDFTVVSNFDLVEALPVGVQTYIDGMGALFTAPGDTAVQWLLDLSGVDGVPQVVIDVAKGIVQDAFDRYTAGTAVGTVFAAGGDIYTILSAFEVGSTLRFTAEPDEAGVFPAGTITERWDHAAIDWTAGACAGSADPNCGRKQWAAGDVGLTVVANPAASVASAYNLTIDPHPVTFEYGAVILFVVEHVILPMTVGYESFDNFIYELLGNEGCATCNPGTEAQVCCEQFAEATTEAPGMTRDIAKNLCVSGVPAVLAQVKGWVTGLDLDAGDNLTIGTKKADGSASTPCVLQDADLDNRVEGLGKPEGEGRCTWYFGLDVGAASPVDFSGRWHGVRQ